MSKTEATNSFYLVEIEKKNNANNNTPQIIVNRVQDFTTPNLNGKSYIQIPPLSKKSTKRTDTSPLDIENSANKDKENENNVSQLKNSNFLTYNNNIINNNKLYLSPNLNNEKSSNNSEHTHNSKNRNLLLSPNSNQLTNRGGKYSNKPSNEITKVIFKEPPKFLAIKKEINDNNNKTKRTDRNGVKICKANKKKIKVTFIDQIDKNKKFEEIIDIESIKKYNICYGLPKEDKYIKETVCCSCILF